MARPAVPEPERAVIYIRVSTDQQELSPAAQEDAARAYARYRGLEVAAVEVDHGVSGALAPSARPAMSRALATLAAGDADLLVVSRLDRLGRDVRELLGLVSAATRQGWGLAILDLDLDTTTAGGRLVLTVLGAVAEWERNIISERTRDALAAKRARGARLGRPVEQSDDARARVRALRSVGLSLRATARRLNEARVPTARGGRWHPSTVAGVERSDRLDAEAAARREAS